jgi:hypothetical protein
MYAGATGPGNITFNIDGTLSVKFDGYTTTDTGNWSLNGNNLIFNFLHSSLNGAGTTTTYDMVYNGTVTGNSTNFSMTNGQWVELFTNISDFVVTAYPIVQNLYVGTPLTSVGFTPLSVSSGSAPPYTYSVTSGTLPTGLILNAHTGAVTGTPTSLYSTANVVFSVSDANNVVSKTTSTVNFTVVTSPTLTCTLPLVLQNGQCVLSTATFSLSPTNPFVGIGQTIQLSVAGGNPPTSIIWSSLSTSVATVDQTGLVTGISLGSAIISAYDPSSLMNGSTQLMNGYTQLEVSDMFVQVTSASCMNLGSVSLFGGSTLYPATRVAGQGIASGSVGSWIEPSPDVSNGNLDCNQSYTVSTCNNWTSVHSVPIPGTGCSGSVNFCSRGPNDPPTTSFTGFIDMTAVTATSISFYGGMLNSSSGYLAGNSRSFPFTCP